MESISQSAEVATQRLARITPAFLHGNTASEVGPFASECACHLFSYGARPKTERGARCKHRPTVGIEDPTWTVQTEPHLLGTACQNQIKLAKEILPGKPLRSGISTTQEKQFLCYCHPGQSN